MFFSEWWWKCGTDFFFEILPRLYYTSLDTVYTARWVDICWIAKTTQTFILVFGCFWIWAGNLKMSSPPKSIEANYSDSKYNCEEQNVLIYSWYLRLTLFFLRFSVSPIQLPFLSSCYYENENGRLSIIIMTSFHYILLIFLVEFRTLSVKLYTVVCVFAEVCVLWGNEK
jgi:hypothetical protein